MANRYWVGGTGYWSDDDNHWATSSGGSPADGNLPTSSDDVFIDANSGFGSGGIITLDDAAEVNNFTSNSGHTYTISKPSSGISFYGSVSLESGITITGNANIFFDNTTTANIATNGVVLTGAYCTFEGTGQWTLQDNLIISGEFNQENGTFDANDHNVTANNFSFYADTGYTPTVIMGSGTWEATGGGWTLDEQNEALATITPETSTIKMSGGGDFYTSNKTYNNLWFTTSGGITSGSSIFNDLKIDAGLTITFLAGTTQTVSTFTAVGISGNLITLNSSDTVTPTQFTLSKSSGVVECDYLNLSNSNATGGATWYAGSHSVDTTNNDGWIFTDPPAPEPTTTSIDSSHSGLQHFSSLQNLKKF